MGEIPLIYDRPQVAPTINMVIDPSSYCCAGPFELEELLHMNCKVPSRFHIFRPQFGKIEEYQKEIVADFMKNKPDIIVYKKIFSVVIKIIILLTAF